MFIPHIIFCHEHYGVWTEIIYFTKLVIVSFLYLEGANVPLLLIYFSNILNDKSMSLIYFPSYIFSLTEGISLFFQVQLDSWAVSGLLQRSTVWSKWTEGQTLD